MSGDPRSRYFDTEQFDEFWANNEYAEERGCYVFALRRSRGYAPIYVGKTGRQFCVECFTDRNYRLMHTALRGQVGTLVLFLLCQQRRRGRVNMTAINDLERYLVEAALDKNPDLANRVYTRTQPGFKVNGVHRSSGRPNGGAIELKRALSL
jgi:hypothetical protein